MDSNNHLVLTYHCDSSERLEALAADLGRTTTAGTVITLAGPLGAGKTTFVRGFMHGYAPEYPDQVSSPTFALMNCYHGPTPVYHYDCYRLHGSDDALALGIEDHLYGAGVCLIEWPERISDLLTPLPHQSITISYQGEDQRVLVMKGLSDQQRHQMPH